MLVDASEEGRCSSPSTVEDIEQVPPPKEEEFEKFKKGRGLKIHEAFLSNKGMCCYTINLCNDRSIADQYLSSTLPIGEQNAC